MVDKSMGSNGKVSSQLLTHLCSDYVHPLGFWPFFKLWAFFVLTISVLKVIRDVSKR